MTKLREEAPTHFGDKKVVVMEDYLNQVRYHYENENQEEMDYPASNVLKYVLEDESFIAVRPSGTEPKIKFYIGVKGKTQQEADDKVATLETALDALTKA